MERKHPRIINSTIFAFNPLNTKPPKCTRTPIGHFRKCEDKKLQLIHKMQQFQPKQNRTWRNFSVWMIVQNLWMPSAISASYNRQIRTNQISDHTKPESLANKQCSRRYIFTWAKKSLSSAINNKKEYRIKKNKDISKKLKTSFSCIRKQNNQIKIIIFYQLKIYAE